MSLSMPDFYVRRHIPDREELGMPKIISTVLVAAAAAAALSACNPEAISNAAGTHKNHAVGNTSSYTVAEQNAIASAQGYLDMDNGFSRAGLIDQLSSKAGE